MGSISGSVEAKCKECKCRFSWHLDNFPFIDAEIIGTCDKCFEKIDHDCVDELTLDENDMFSIVGRKEFKEVENDNDV